MKNITFIRKWAAVVLLQWLFCITTLYAEDRFPVFAFNGIPPSHATRAYYKDMAAAGFNISLTSCKDMQEVQKVLDAARGTGVRIAVVGDDIRDRSKQFVERFGNDEALYGYYIYDEPRMTDLKEAKIYIDRIRRYDKTRPCYMNLYPNYDEGTVKTIGVKDYSDYLKAASELDLPFISFDYYPIANNEVRKTWYKNLEDVRTESLRTGKPFWAFVLATAHNDYPIPTLPMLRLQVYSNLAYGAKGIEYFTYWTPEPTKVWNYNNGPITVDGKKTATYNLVKRMNKEMMPIAQYFMEAEVKEIVHLGNVPRGAKKLKYLPSGFRKFQTSGSDGLIISSLSLKDKNYLMVVNRDFKRTAHVTIDCNSSVKQFTKQLRTVSASSNYDIQPGDIIMFVSSKATQNLAISPLKPMWAEKLFDWDIPRNCWLLGLVIGLIALIYIIYVVRKKNKYCSSSHGERKKLTKILFCDNTLWGLINFRGGVIEHFVKKGVEVVIVAPEKEDKQMTTTIPDGVKYIPTVMDRTAEDISSNYRFMMMLLRIYKQERPDVIFHYTIKPNIYGSAAAWRLGIPSVAMITGMGTVFAHKSLKMKMAQGLYKFGLKFSKKVIFLNAENRRVMLQKGFCKEKNAVMLPAGEGLDLKKFPYYDNSSSEIIFLMISRVLADKGYYEYVEAAKIVKQRHPEVRFQLLGFADENNPNGIKRSMLDEDVRRGYIEYLGYTHDMAAVYERKGIVVTLPSYHEGLNRTLMEACATGKPIVTTDIPGCRETVEEGINGFLCKPKDAQSLAAAIEKYIALTAEERQKMSAASRKLAEEKFSQDKVIDVYEKIISELV